MRSRLALALATALALPLVFGGAASAGHVEQWCWENVPSLRLSALVCPKIPDDAP